MSESGDKLLGIRVNLATDYLEVVILGTLFRVNMGTNNLELELIWGQITWN